MHPDLQGKAQVGARVAPRMLKGGESAATGQRGVGISRDACGPWGRDARGPGAAARLRRQGKQEPGRATPGGWRRAERGKHAAGGARRGKREKVAARGAARVRAAPASGGGLAGRGGPDGGARRVPPLPARHGRAGAALPAAAPCLRPALSPLPPSRLLAGSFARLPPRCAPRAHGAGRGPRGRGGRPCVRVREPSPSRGPKFARRSGRRRGSPGRPPAPFPRPRPGPAGSPGDASRAPANSEAGTPQRQLEAREGCEGPK